jgi:outer membrane protein
MTLLKKIMIACSAPIALTAAAHAGDPNGKFQAKIMATGVLPDGEITSVLADNVGLPAGSQTDVSDSYVPTVALEYFFTPNISVETICCITPHDVDGAGALQGGELIDDAIVLPATITLKYHLTGFGDFKPYLGAGPAHFFIFDEDVGAGSAPLGVTDVDLSDDFGFALQAGFDVPIDDNGWLFSLDAKRYFVDTTATFSGASGVLIQTEHDLDPWVVSAGIGYRF